MIPSPVNVEPKTDVEAKCHDCCPEIECDSVCCIFLCGKRIVKRNPENRDTDIKIKKLRTDRGL